MDRNTLEWYDLLARGLLWIAGIVLLLAIVAAVVVAGSDNAVGFAPEAEEQGRGFVALASLGGGAAAAGLLAGLGAILRLLVADRLSALPPREPQRGEDDDLPSVEVERDSKPKREPKPKRERRRAGRTPREGDAESGE